MPRSSAVLAFLLFVGTEVLGAQSPGSFEITGFGRYSFFDDALGRLDDQVGAGGSLGFFFLPNLAIEAEAATTTTEAAAAVNTIDVSNTPIRGRLTYHIPLGGNATSIRIGAGYVRDTYGKDADMDENGIAIGITVTDAPPNQNDIYDLLGTPCGCEYELHEVEEAVHI